MMLALSMRMTRTTYSSGDEELRDALAHDWWRFFQAVMPDMPVLPIPNTGQQAINLVEHLPITALLLTGGDDWGIFPQRDMTEELLFQWAKRRSLPVLGVCRGAQIINQFMGGKASAGFDESHARTQHSVDIHTGTYCPLSNITSREVNSYHRLGIKQENLASGLKAWAIAPDNSVEAFAADKGKIIGIMWHPEREEKPSEHDIYLIRHLFIRK